MSTQTTVEIPERKASEEWTAFMEGDALLRITNYHAEYRTERAVAKACNGVDLVIRKGESVGLVGETGAGKTTLALSTMDLLPKGIGFHVGGSIEFAGSNVHKMSKKELTDLRGAKISMVFQNPLTALNPVFRVCDQIGMALRVHNKLSKHKAIERAGELLEVVGIPSYRVKDYPFQFSGGMRQRVGIAAALACNPQLLIADEPTTALDVTIQAQVLELMKDLQKQYEASLLMITHNLGIISELCQFVAVMYGGRIIEYGTVKSVFASPLHPYTFGLIGALPSLEGPRNRLIAVPGIIADASNLPGGCAFHPRCENCRDECCTEQPPMVHAGDGHFVACFIQREG